MSNPKPSEKVRELIQKSRIVSFTSWQNSYLDTALAQFQAADDQGRYLSDTDLDDLAKLIPVIATYISTVKLLTEQATNIVDEART
jgi:hypothetical protein